MTGMVVDEPWQQEGERDRQHPSRASSEDSLDINTLVLERSADKGGESSCTPQKTPPRAPLSPTGKIKSDTKTFRRLLPYRIDSETTQTTQTTASTGLSCDSFRTKGSEEPVAHDNRPSSGVAFFQESYDKLVRDKLLLKEGGTTQGAGSQHLHGSFSSGQARDNPRSQTELSYSQSAGAGYGSGLPASRDKPHAQTDMSYSQSAGASYFQQSYDKLVRDKLHTPEDSSEFQPASYFQQSYDKLVRERVDKGAATTTPSVSKPPRPTAPRGNYMSAARALPSPEDDELNREAPYDNLKRFMREGMGRVSDANLESMAVNKLQFARQASLRGSALFSRKSIEQVEASLNANKPPPSLVMADVDDDDSEVEEVIKALRGEIVGRRSIEMSDLVEDVSPIGSPVMERKRPSRPLTTSSAHVKKAAPRGLTPPRSPKRSLSIDMCGSVGENAAESYSLGSSEGAAELFNEYHDTRINPQDARPGAYAADGPPTGNHPLLMGPQPTARLEPPRRDRWAALRRMSTNFSSRRRFFRRGNSRNTDMVDARVQPPNELEDIPSENFNFSSMPPELRPVQSEPQPKKKKRGRGLRKMLSKAGRTTKSIITEVAYYM